MDFDPGDEHLARDVPKALSSLKDVQEMVSGVETSLRHLTARVDDGDLDTTKGLSLLELKCHVMVNYLMDLVQLLMRKCRGEKIGGDESVERLVENRTVLEKMRPIEQKLKYHIEKLLKVASGAIGNKDPLSFRANPKNLVGKLDDGEEADGIRAKKDEEEEQKPKFYVPPKLAAMHYDGDLGEESREKRHMENARKRALSSSIMRDLRAEYYDGPDEFIDTSFSAKRKESRQSKSRREYEEDYMVRLTVSKKEKAMERKRATLSGLEGLTHFGDISALTADDRGVEFKMPKKRMRTDKKTMTFKGKKLRKGRMRRKK